MTTEDQQITTPIIQELASTRFACSNLTRLSGGNANFVYRGELRQPLEDGTTTVILKHAEDYLALLREFKLPADRCLIEEISLRALKDFAPITKENQRAGSQITIKTPHLYDHNRKTHTHIQEDLPNAQDLKSYFISATNGAAVSEALARCIGRALGEWLLAFHIWADEESQRDLKIQMGQNTLMQDLKCSVNYDNLVKAVERFPALLEGSRGVFEQVRDYANEERGKGAGEGYGMIHGDFWTANVLLPNNLLHQQPCTPTLFVTDWELTQCGSRALDLGQMIAEMYMIKHFKGFDVGVWLIQDFVEGYRPALTESIAFRTAIHAGVHLIAWGSMVPWGTDEQVEEVVRVGRDFVVKGWGKDREWLENSVLGCLF